MTYEQITELCKKRELEILRKYFGNAVREAVITKPEHIGEYTMDLPLKMEDEYKLFLEDLWKEYAPEEMKGTTLFMGEQITWKQKNYKNRELIDRAHEDAMKRTLWERITKTNHIDVAFYKGLLEQYSHELLINMRNNFLNEITSKNGNEIQKCDL